MPGITFDFKAEKFHINANGSGTIKSSSGTLAGVVINTKGATSNVLTLSDGAAAFAVIDTTSAVTALNFDHCRFGSLAYSLAGGTAADITVLYT